LIGLDSWTTDRKIQTDSDWNYDWGRLGFGVKCTCQVSWLYGQTITTDVRQEIFKVTKNFGYT